MVSFNDMYQAAKAAPEQEQRGDLLGPADLKEGEIVECEIVYSKAGQTAKKATSFVNRLKVLSGDNAGGEFFDNIYFSAGDGAGNFTDGQVGYNKRLVSKLEGAGLGDAFFGSHPSDEGIAKALLGSKVKVKIRWQAPRTYIDKNGDEQTAVGLDNTTSWAPLDGGGSAGYVPSGSPAKGF